ncbi:MAG: alpha/beta fold hydrolase [Phycisphaerae bacterium]|nr:alpha/beta fold hydrolase [Phycisphaerae bacterium]
MSLLLQDPAPREANADPVVLVHGFLGEPADWDAVIASLDVPRATWRADLLAAAVPSFDLASLAAALAKEIRRNGLAPATVIGYSLGARVAMTALANHPDDIARVLAISGSPGLVDPVERTERAAADDALAAVLERDGLAPFLERWYAQPLFASLRNHPDYGFIARRRLSGNGGAWARVLRDASPGRNPSLWERLPSMSSRLWLAVGALDGKYLDLANRAHERAPAMPLSIVEGAGHAVHLERPDAVASLVDRLPILLWP